MVKLVRPRTALVQPDAVGALAADKIMSIQLRFWGMSNLLISR